MKLISNTSFGEFCKSKEKEFPTRNVYLDWYEEIRTNFDKFLKQHLKLEMFVPCDEDGEILDEPKDYEQRLPNIMTEYNDEIYRYKKAKEKVLVEGIEFRTNGGVNFLTINEDTFAFHDFNIKFKDLTVEFLVEYNLQLTENAIKQIGL